LYSSLALKLLIFIRHQSREVLKRYEVKSDSDLPEKQNCRKENKEDNE